MNAVANEKLTRFLAYLEADPQNARLLSDALELALGIRDMSVADDLAARIQQLSQPDDTALFSLSTWHMHHQNWIDAAAILGSLTEKNPASEPLLYNLAQCHAYSGKFAEAYNVMQPLLQHTAITVATGLLLARCAMYQSDYATAEKTLLQLLKSDATNTDVSGLLALVYRDSDRPGEALQCAEQALAHNPSNSDALLVLGESAFDSQNIDEANRYFETVLEHKQSHRALRGRSMIQLLRGEPDVAEAGIDEIFALGQSSINDYHLLALSRLMQNRHDDAIAVLDQSLRLEPGNTESLVLKAMIQMLKQDSAQAKATLSGIKFAGGNKVLETLTEGLQDALQGNEEQTKKLLQPVFNTQSPYNNTYGEILSRLMR